MARRYQLMGALGLTDQMSPTLRNVLGLINATTAAAERLNRAIGGLGRHRTLVRLRAADEISPVLSRIEQHMTRVGRRRKTITLVGAGAPGQTVTTQARAASTSVARLTRQEESARLRAERETAKVLQRQQRAAAVLARQQETARLRAERVAEQARVRQERAAAQMFARQQREAERARLRQERAAARTAALAERRMSRTLSTLGWGATRVARGLWRTTTGMAGGIVRMVTMPFRALMSLPGLLGLGGGVFLFGSLVKGALDFSSSMEQAKIAFTTMLGSAKKAGRFVADLFEFAAKTPFEFPEVQHGARMLLAMGFAEKEVLPTLTSIGNAVSALGASSEVTDRVILAIGQIRAKGKLMGQEMRQLAEAGIPIIDILSQKLGMAKEEIMEGGNAGITADRALTALFQGLDERFGGGMVMQSRTWRGLFTTMKDQSMRLIGGLGDGIRMRLQPRLAAIVDFFDRNPQQVARWRQNLINLGYSASRSLQRLFEGAFRRINDLFNDPAFQRADFFGKVRIAWDRLIAEPFAAWWAGPGKGQLGRVAGEMGGFLGGAIAGAVRAVFGLGALDGTASPFVDAGITAGEAFVTGFTTKLGEVDWGQVIGTAFREHPVVSTGVSLGAGNLVTGGLLGAGLGALVKAGAKHAWKALFTGGAAAAAGSTGAGATAATAAASAGSASTAAAGLLSSTLPPVLLGVLSLWASKRWQETFKEQAARGPEWVPNPLGGAMGLPAPLPPPAAPAPPAWGVNQKTIHSAPAPWGGNQKTIHFSVKVTRDTTDDTLAEAITEKLFNRMEEHLENS